jgi:hypothetical protein
VLHLEPGLLLAEITQHTHGAPISVVNVYFTPICALYFVFLSAFIEHLRVYLTRNMDERSARCSKSPRRTPVDLDCSTSKLAPRVRSVGYFPQGLLNTTFSIHPCFTPTPNF